AEDAQPRFLEMIDNPAGQRLLGTYHGQADPFLAREGGELVEFRGFEGDVDAIEGGAGVTRSAEHALGAGGLGQFPYEGMFAAALADDEDFHPVIVEGRPQTFSREPEASAGEFVLAL